MKKDVGDHENSRFRLLEAKLRWLGSISRLDLERNFGLKKSSVTNLMKDFLERIRAAGVDAPGPERGVMRAAIFPSSEGVFGDLMPLDEVFRNDSNLGFSLVDAFPVSRYGPTPEVMSMIVEAMKERRTVVIRYGSMNSGRISDRPICPHTIIRSPNRLHVRAFDHTRGRFADFVFGRIFECRKPVAGEARPWTGIDVDAEWHDRTEILISPSRSLTSDQKSIIAREWLMKSGSRSILVRRANLYYALEAMGLRESVLGNGEQPSGLVTYLHCDNAQSLRSLLGISRA